MALGCDIEADDMEAVMLLIIGADDCMEDGWFEVLGRMAIGGAAEHEEAGVETLVGEAAEAGLAAELGEVQLTAVVIDNDLDGAASGFPGFGAGLKTAASAAAMVTMVVLTGGEVATAGNRIADFNVSRVFLGAGSVPRSWFSTRDIRETRNCDSFDEAN